MRSQASILENFFVSSYHDAHLPPLLEVIYQEAIRGHHMLFDKRDVERFEKDAFRAAPDDADGWSEELEPIVVDLLGCNDFRAMVDRIDALTPDVRRKLYKLYQHALWIWANYVKSQMN